MAKIITDMNKRERERYATTAELLGAAFVQMHQSLLSEDDTAAYAMLVTIAASGGAFLSELLAIFQTAVTVEDVPDHPPMDYQSPPPS